MCEYKYNPPPALPQRRCLNMKGLYKYSDITYKLDICRKIKSKRPLKTHL